VPVFRTSFVSAFLATNFLSLHTIYHLSFIISIQYILSLLKRLILKRDSTRNEMAITPAGRAPMFITVYSIIMGLSTIFVFLRLYTRAVIVKNLGADDYFAAISWVSPLNILLTPTVIREIELTGYCNRFYSLCFILLLQQELFMVPASITKILSHNPSSQLPWRYVQ